MALDPDTCRRGALRLAGLITSVLLGLFTLVGSGGGVSVDGNGCFLAPGPCAGDFPNEPRTPVVEPARANAQVGGDVVFTVSTPGITPTAYLWRRALAGGSFDTLAGATGSSLTRTGVNLADDGANYQVVVTGVFEGKAVTLGSTFGFLTVSSQPPVVLQDSEFAPADWLATAQLLPATSGPTHVEDQVISAGSPGAWRRSTLVMTPGPSRMTLFNTYLGASYDPATQGAVRVVEFSLDCQALPGALGVGPLLLLEQGRRHYIAGGPILCGASTWSHATLIPGSFQAGDFFQFDGPACAVGESCPDFSATGPVIRFGYFNDNQGTAGFAGAAGGLGVDNWKVSVWRR
jgi:hypothetical protein